MFTLTRWDDRFMGLAQHISTFSKDPSTKVGALIVDQKNRIVSMGFNGFPRGVNDTSERLHDRNVKYEMIIHAEINAILFAKCPLEGATLYTYPLPPCARCAAMIINAGISKVIAPVDKVNEPNSRWLDFCLLALEMFTEAGVVQLAYTPTTQSKEAQHETSNTTPTFNLDDWWNSIRGR